MKQTDQDRHKLLMSFMQQYMNNSISIDCPLCGKTKVVSVASKSRGGLKINSDMCTRCGLIFLNPKPVPQAYADFYASGDYRRFLNVVKKKVDYNNIDNFFSQKRFDWKREIGRKLAADFFDGILKPGDLYFDFGCDFGGTLAGVKDQTGCDIMGNEPSEICAEYIRKKMGIEIVNSTIEEVDERQMEPYKGKVKLASIIGTLEHVNDPVKALSVAREILEDEGYLYINSFDIISRMRAQKESVGEVATIDHQYSFHEKVYGYLLRRCGFKPIRVELIGDPGGKKQLTALAQKTKNVSQEIDYDTAAIVEEVQRLNQV